MNIDDQYNKALDLIAQMVTERRQLISLAARLQGEAKSLKDQLRKERENGKDETPETE